MSSERRPGVASADELKEFIAAAGDRLVIIDTRNPNFDVEPEDETSVALAPLPTPETRPRAQLLTFDRTTNTFPLPDVDKDSYIITHCGAGGRGNEAKKYLEQHGFKNVINGGGPKEKELWELYGDK
jgi:rhodanese-related sulfurtransferase